MQYSCWVLTVLLFLTMVATLTSANDVCLTEEQYKDINKKDLSDLEGRMKEELWRMKEQQTHLESIIRNMADSLSSLTKKISPHCTDSWRTESPNKGRTGPTELPIMYGIEINEDTTLYEAFYEAARTGDIGYITVVLARGNSSSSINRYSLLTWRNEDYMDLTSLHVAAAWGHDQVVLALLEAGASPGVKDRDGYTPLEWAATQGHSETLNILLQPKYLAQVNQQDTLMWASLKGQLDVVEALINIGTSVLVKDDRGWNALHYAAASNSFDIAQLLLQNGVDKRQRNESGHTPSDWARRMANNELAKFIDNWQ